jgi:acyl carrier protein
MEKIAKEQNKNLAPLTNNLALLESGLDSLGFAILVTRLEDTLGVDPFSETDAFSFPVTFGDLVKAYENALIKTGQ